MSWLSLSKKLINPMEALDSAKTHKLPQHNHSIWSTWFHNREVGGAVEEAGPLGAGDGDVDAVG
jgi:hypothetical protein